MFVDGKSVWTVHLSSCNASNPCAVYITAYCGAYLQRPEDQDEDKLFSGYSGKELVFSDLWGEGDNTTKLRLFPTSAGSTTELSNQRGNRIMLLLLSGLQ